MKLHLFVITVFFNFMTVGYSQFTDNFSDGDFTNNPPWFGNTADFIVDNFQLRSNGPAVTPTTIYLYTASTKATDAQWEFFANPKCATSSGNYMDIILISDVNALNGPFNGYFVRIGGTPDEVSLFRKDGTNEIKIIDGTDGLIASSSNNPTRVKVTRDISNNWTLEADPTGTGNNYLLQGTVVDATYTTGNYFGVKVTYSASNNIKYYFDDFYVGNIIYDTNPPVPVNVVTINSGQIDLYFDENVELNSSQTTSNYSINNGIGQPVSAVRDAVNFKLVHLTLGASLQNGQNYTVTINNVQDLSGNATSNATIGFTYYQISPPSFRDVVINELMADPDPAVGLPNKEYVEIFNASNKNFNLNGWKLTEGTSTATLGNYLLLPGQYLILCAIADTGLFSSYGQVMGLSPWPSLNNSGDNIILYSDASVKIDAVNYDLSWYKNTSKDDGGWSLEQINPFLPCSGIDNWQASNNTNGGTPGQVNSVFSNAADTSKPYMKKIQILTLNQIEIQFNESMDSSSLANATINISPNINIASQIAVGPEFKSLIVNLASNIDSATVYWLKISGPTDCSANTLLIDSIRFAIGVSPQPFDLVINEIFANPSGTPALPDAEFVELYNASTKPLLLNGLRFTDGTTSTSIPNTNLLPGDYLIICPSSSVALFQPFGQTFGLSNWPSLNNSGDKLAIYFPGKIIHRVYYSDTWHEPSKKPGGWSLELKDPANPCGEANNWTSSVDPAGGTPGKINSVFQSNPDISPPVLSKVFALSQDSVVLEFNEIIDSLSATLANISISGNINIASRVVYFQNSMKKLLLNLSNPLQPKTAYTVTVAGVNDCKGNSALTQAEFYLFEKSDPGDVIINEILFNPRGNGSDYVEIYNKSDKYINLQNWFLGTITDEKPASLKIISTEPLLFKPNAFLVITKDSANVQNEYFTHAKGRFIQLSTLPTYANESGNAIVCSPDTQIIDRFDYNENMHFAMLSSFDGVALERIRYEAPTQDPSNWHSAAESVGFGTPGLENSQHNVVKETTDFQLDLNIFSPDNDGYQDIVTLYYQLSEPGYVANVYIYNHEGRMIKHWVKNQLLAAKGFWTWDGIDDQQQKAPMGAYIVFIDAYNTQGKAIKKKLTLVVAGKLK
ncbi:MAG: hypothetical protein KatS3mg034_0173 [Vicingaceae bacterium]|nr:MAG: hypothetical protein KatS3mg034_0173 [Vicingaceae bacterium]